jgi:acetyl esterase/lipase
LVIVHGGFWRHFWTRDTTESIAIDAADRGFATLNVEYRRVGAGGGGSRSVTDVVAAITHALNDDRIDATNWSIAGHSAGGQLAVVAAHSLRHQGNPPRIAVPMGGVLDLAAAVAEGIGDHAAAAYLGDESPFTLSPVELAPFEFPIAVAHGMADDRVPFSQAESMIQAVERAGERAIKLSTRRGGHYEFLEPNERAWIEVAENVASHAVT